MGEDVTRTPFDQAYTAAHYDRLAEGEIARWNRDPNMRIQRAVYIEHLRRRVRPGDEVLDAGCGPGTFATVCIDGGAHVTCLDLSAVQLELCRSRERRARGYVRGSITDLPFPKSSFDVTLALGAPLSYCFDQAPRAATELLRVTRPGGTVGLSVGSLFGSLHRFLPGALSLAPDLNRRIVATGDLLRDISGHEIHLFRPPELRSLLEAAGFVDIELHAPGWLSLLHEDLPEEGSESWMHLLELELEASAESPGAGTHILAWARRPEPGSP